MRKAELFVFGIMRGMKRKLTRSDDRWLAGVIGGIAQYFEHDPLLYRLGFITFLVFTGFMPGLLLYVIGWVLMPTGPDFKYQVVNE